MKPIQIAYEILSESRRLRETFKSNRTDFNAVHASMYSIFECYAHGIIDWVQVQKRYHKSLMEYANLYSFDKEIFTEEKARMFEEYERVLREWKKPLDEYKIIAEKKMTSNIVVKKQISESIAQQHSRQYFNRMLSENDIKHTSRLKTWKRVMEAYPNLTAKDEERVRMLTIMEAPMTSLRPMARPAISNIGSTEMSPGGQMTGSTRNFPDVNFNPRAGQMSQPSFPGNAGLMNTPTPPRPATTAPATSLRPMSRPTVRQPMGEAEDDTIDTEAFDATSLKALADLKARYPHAKDTFDALLNAYMDVKSASIRDDSELENEIEQNVDRIDRGTKRIAELESRISELTKELADDEEKLDGVRDDKKIQDLIKRIEKLEREHKELTTEAVSDEKADEFHRKLDKLVHAYLGHSSDEKAAGINEDAETKAHIAKLQKMHDTAKANYEKTGASRERMKMYQYADAISEYKKQLEERKMSKSEKAKEERLKDKYDDSDMKQSMKDQYGDRWEDVYYATIRKKAMESFAESLNNLYDPDPEEQERAEKEAEKEAKKKKKKEEKKKKEPQKKQSSNSIPSVVSTSLSAVPDLQRSTGMYSQASGGSPAQAAQGNVKENTTAGSIASVAKPMGKNKMVRRTGVAPNALDQNKLFDETKKDKK